MLLHGSSHVKAGDASLWEGVLEIYHAFEVVVNRVACVPLPPLTPLTDDPKQGGKQSPQHLHHLHDLVQNAIRARATALRLQATDSLAELLWSPNVGCSPQWLEAAALALRGLRKRAKMEQMPVGMPPACLLLSFADSIPSFHRVNSALVFHSDALGVTGTPPTHFLLCARVGHCSFPPVRSAWSFMAPSLRP